MPILCIDELLDAAVIVGELVSGRKLLEHGHAGHAAGLTPNYSDLTTEVSCCDSLSVDE